MPDYIYTKLPKQMSMSRTRQPIRPVHGMIIYNAPAQSNHELFICTCPGWRARLATKKLAYTSRTHRLVEEHTMQTLDSQIPIFPSFVHGAPEGS
jgi:hypothetical protein